MVSGSLLTYSANRPKKPVNSSAVVFFQSLASEQRPGAKQGAQMLSRLLLTAVAAWHSPDGVQAPRLGGVGANPASSTKARVNSPRCT